MQLFRCYLSRFAKRVLASLWTGRPLADLDRYLADYELHAAALSFNEWFGQLRPRPIAYDGQAADLKQLAQFAEDLVDDDGRWTDDLADATLLAREAEADLQDRICRLRDAIAAESGPKQAHNALNTLQRRFSEHRDAVTRDPRRWSAQDAGKLQLCASRLRAMSQPPRGLWKVLHRIFRGKITPQRWLSSGQQALLRTQLLPTIRSAAERRFADALQRHLLDLFDRILGRPGHPGIIQTASAALQQYKRLLATVSSSLADQAHTPVRSSNEILLVDDLDMPVDPAGTLRFVEVIEAEVRKSGCRPQQVADLLRHEGLVVRGRTYLPMEWPDLPANRLQARLMKKVEEYLAYQDEHARLNLSRPQTAVEHVATITLDHPSLRHLLLQKAAELVRRSGPYAIFGRIAGASPVVHGYLFCHPEQRMLLQQLLTQCNLANRSHSQSETQRGYELKSPYVATLVQYALAAPGGAQRNLQQALRYTNRVRRDGDIPPLFPEHSYPETRLLEKRPDAIDDARQLLAAAKLAGVVQPLGGPTTSLQLAKHEPRLQYLFVEERTVAEPNSAEFFAEQLKSSDLVNFVRVLFPELPSWLHTAEDLRLEQDAPTVASKLAALGVVQAEPGGLFRIAAIPEDRAVDLPAGLYKRTQGRTIGLTEERFLGQLMENDWLYNTVFWQVADALDQGRISQADVPQFLVQYLHRLEQVAA